MWTETGLNVKAPEKLVPQLAGEFKDALAMIQWLRSVPFTAAEE